MSSSLYLPSPCIELHWLSAFGNLCSVRIGTQCSHHPITKWHMQKLRNYMMRSHLKFKILSLLSRPRSNGNFFSRPKSLREPYCNWNLVLNDMIIMIILVLGLNRMIIFYLWVQTFILFIRASGPDISLMCCVSSFSLCETGVIKVVLQFFLFWRVRYVIYHQLFEA